MQIIIDGKEAVLKKGSSFDFIAENRLFSGSDSYTLTITFPLRDCPQNIEIFGHINRSELAIDHYVFDCEIRDRAFSRFGTLTITEISDVNVKAQFLEGRAAQNFSNKFDDFYINDLNLGSLGAGTPSSTSPLRVWDPTTSDYFLYPGHCYVALPWVSADSGVTHNFADYDSVSGKYSWSEDTKDISYMPYLLYLTARICQSLGYRWDFKE